MGFAVLNPSYDYGLLGLGRRLRGRDLAAGGFRCERPRKAVRIGARRFVHCQLNIIDILAVL